MALDLDGFAVLRSIAAHPGAFPDIAAATAHAARSLVTKQLNSKSTGLRSLRDIREALGVEAFNLVMDGIPDTQIKSIVARLDKHHPELKAADARWRRLHVTALVDGSCEPATKPIAKRRPGNKVAAKPPAAREFLDFKSAGATRRK
jgi:hypothetical protein